MVFKKIKYKCLILGTSHNNTILFSNFLFLSLCLKTLLKFFTCGYLEMEFFLWSYCGMKFSQLHALLLDIQLVCLEKIYQIICSQILISRKLIYISFANVVAKLYRLSDYKESSTTQRPNQNRQVACHINIYEPME